MQEGEEWLEPAHLRPFSWWQRYAEGLGAFSTTARHVLETDCRYIVEQGVMAAGPPGDLRWPASRVRRGLVMGAVQSGKTASLVGVAAMAMDQGVDVVVVLGGTRISLWRQTLTRFSTALRPAAGSILRWQLRPVPGSEDDAARAGLDSLYSLPVSAAKRSFEQKRPVVLVAMKQVDHLRELGRTIRGNVLAAASRLDRLLHVLVLDDEADDGSVLDARAEAGLDPAMMHLKQVPRSIVDLWDSRPHGGATLDERVFVTYMGYTATPQANFLQSDQNPLSPKDFVVALRTPHDQGTVNPRSTTYAEPEGPSKYYSGGELFYRRLARADLCVPLDGGGDDHELADALRAYLVAGALKGLSSPSTPLAGLRERRFASNSEARDCSPEPHSMLVHPAAAVATHFEAAARVLAWFGGLDVDTARDRLDDGDWTVARAGVLMDLDQREERWTAWLASYQHSAGEVSHELSEGRAPFIEQDWAVVRQHIVDELLPEVRLSVVNSDPRSDDRPQFEPSQTEDGWRAGQDLCTVFVSGNVMARGLTLEGLTTSFFLRASKDPYADTQMQMQRWFGYRGPYLHLCRVFAPRDQLALFRAYHDVDEALRREVVTAMSSGGPVSPQVLQGSRFTATGKIANIANQPLSPGPDPVIQVLGEPDLVDPNLGLVAELFSEASSPVRGARGDRGRLLQRELGLVEVAELLDRLRYRSYNPGDGGWFGSHWASVERQVDIPRGDSEHHRLFRPPSHGGPDQVPDLGACPYQVAAYLRLWDACLWRHARGLFPTDQPDLQWSLVDLTLKREQAPAFRIGLRFGSGGPVREGGLEQLSFEVRAQVRATQGNYLRDEWGARVRGALGYEGDQSFDLPKGSVDGGRRAPGRPGLVLLQIIERPSAHAGLAVGLVIPSGGPDHFAARTTDD